MGGGQALVVRPMKKMASFEKYLLLLIKNLEKTIFFWGEDYSWFMDSFDYLFCPLLKIISPTSQDKNWGKFQKTELPPPPPPHPPTTIKFFLSAFLSVCPLILKRNNCPEILSIIQSRPVFTSNVNAAYLLRGGELPPLVFIGLLRPSVDRELSLVKSVCSRLVNLKTKKQC